MPIEINLAADLIGHVLTLSSGMVALSVIFFNNFQGDESPMHVPKVLKYSWALHGVTVFSALFSLTALTRLSGSIGDQDVAIVLNHPAVPWPAVLVVFSFFSAVVMTIWYGWKIVSS